MTAGEYVIRALERHEEPQAGGRMRCGMLSLDRGLLKGLVIMFCAASLVSRDTVC